MHVLANKQCCPSRRRNALCPGRLARRAANRPKCAAVTASTSTMVVPRRARQSPARTGLERSVFAALAAVASTSPAGHPVPLLSDQFLGAQHVCMQVLPGSLQHAPGLCHIAQPEEPPALAPSSSGQAMLAHGARKLEPGPCCCSLFYYAVALSKLLMGGPSAAPASAPTPG